VHKKSKLKAMIENTYSACKMLSLSKYSMYNNSYLPVHSICNRHLLFTFQRQWQTVQKRADWRCRVKALALGLYGNKGPETTKTEGVSNFHKTFGPWAFHNVKITINFLFYFFKNPMIPGWYPSDTHWVSWGGRKKRVDGLFKKWDTLLCEH
jgi:hypothetical protein